MHPTFLRSLVLLGFSISLLARAQGAPQSGGDFSNNPQPNALPSDVIVVKGAWSSASDSVTPVPEGGREIGRASCRESVDVGGRRSVKKKRRDCRFLVSVCRGMCGAIGRRSVHNDEM